MVGEAVARHWRETRRRFLVVGAMTPLGLLACNKLGQQDEGSDSTTGASEPTTVFTTLVTPDPAPVRASSDSLYQWETTFTVTLTETAGVAATAMSLSGDLQQAAAGIVITPLAGTDETFRMSPRATGNRIEASGTLSVDFDFFYTLPNGGHQALATINFNMSDDVGAQHLVTVEAKIG
jgi:hypothetical protein